MPLLISDSCVPALFPSPPRSVMPIPDEAAGLGTLTITLNNTDQGNARIAFCLLVNVTV